MKKISLADKTRGAWAVAISRDPARKTYGEDGWEVWCANRGKLTQAELATLYGVSLPTSQRWHREDRVAR